MQTMDDLDLLREYVRGGSESAFEALVKQHVHLVYSAALRQVRDPAMAGDVTQTVFIILARKAATLGPGTVLSGWLYRTAQFAGSKALRSEVRRRTREQEAAQMEPSQPDTAWEQIAPHLEQAMAHLGDADRNAVVLRYFENKSLKAVGAALGVNEDSAQKRVARAVEKLRHFFSKRGAALPAAVLTSALSAHAVQAAPAGITSAALMAATPAAAAATTSISTLIKGTLILMAWTKAKTGIAIGVACLLATAILLTTAALLGPLHHRGPIVIDEAPPESAKFPSRFWAAVISPDGKTLATTGGGYNMPQEAGEIVLWDLAAGREKLIRRQPATIRSMAFSHDGKLVAFGDFSGATRVMNAASGEITASLTNHQGIVNSVLFTPRDETILSTCFDGTVTLWDYRNGRDEVAFATVGERPLSVALSPDNSKLIAVTWEGNGYVWDLAKREQLYSFRGAFKNAMVEGLAFAPDGRTFMTGSRDSLLRIWNTASGEAVQDLTGEKTIVTEAVFSPDGKTLFTGGFKGDLMLWNPATGEHLKTIGAHAERFYGLALTADGKRLVTAGWDYTIKIWDVETLQPVATLMRAIPKLDTGTR
jgi:RNA polymerase sigma factor (sigma-70 family)